MTDLIASLLTKKAQNMRRMGVFVFALKINPV